MIKSMGKIVFLCGTALFLVASYALPFWQYDGEYSLNLSGFAYMMERHVYLGVVLIGLVGLALILKRRDLTYFGGFLWLYSMVFLISPSFPLDRNVEVFWSQFQTLKDYIAYGYYVSLVLGLIFWLSLLYFYDKGSKVC